MVIVVGRGRGALLVVILNKILVFNILSYGSFISYFVLNEKQVGSEKYYIGMKFAW